MKRIMLIIGFICVCVLILVLTLPHWLDLNRYRDQYLPLIEQALNRKVKMANVRMMWFPRIGIQLSDVEVLDDPSLTKESFLTVSSIELGVKWKPLFSRRIEIQSLTVHQPTILILRTKDLVLNMATLGKQSSTGNGSGRQDTSILGVLGVEQLIISDGKVTYRDHSHPKTMTYQFEHVSMKTEAVRLGDTAKVSLKATVIPHRLPLSIEASLGPLSENLDIPQIEALLNIGNSQVEVAGQASEGILDLAVNSSSIALEDLPLNIHLAKPLTLDDVFAHITMPLTENSDPPSSHGELAINPFRFQVKMGKSLLHFSGRTTGKVIDIEGTAPVLRSEDLPVTLPLHSPVSVSNLAIKAQVDGVFTRVSTLSCEVFDGRLSVNGTWDGKDMVHLIGKMNDIQVRQVQKTVALSSLNLTGTGAMTWNIKGSFAEQGFRPLWGHAHMTIVNGQLKGVDLLQRIEQILKIKGPISHGRGLTEFSKFQGDIEFLDKSFPVKSVTLEGHKREFFMQGSGSIKHDQSLAINGKLHLGDTVSKKIIQQMPVAKVALEEGHLVTPFTVRGTLTDPQVGLDLGAIQERLRKQVGEAVQDILRGDPKDVQKILKQGEDLLRGIFGR